MRRVVDTNVPIVANGTSDESNNPGIQCRLSSIEFLENIINNGKIVIDIDGEIQREYHRHLNPRGQPGVGDLFYLTVLQSGVDRVERIDIKKNEDGEYQNLPQEVIDAAFDPSDRKFAALAKKEVIPVVNSTDSDWVESLEVLQNNGIEIIFLCGCDPKEWFE